MTTNTYSWNRTEGGYTFTCATFTAEAWQFRSDYGDLQWGCDIKHLDGRTMGSEYLQMDYLKQIKMDLIQRAVAS